MKIRLSELRQIIRKEVKQRYLTEASGKTNSTLERQLIYALGRYDRAKIKNQKLYDDEVADQRVQDASEQIETLIGALQDSGYSSSQIAMIDPRVENDGHLMLDDFEQNQVNDSQKYIHELETRIKSQIKTATYMYIGDDFENNELYNIESYAELFVNRELNIKRGSEDSQASEMMRKYKLDRQYMNAIISRIDATSLINLAVKKFTPLYKKFRLETARARSL